MLILNDLRRISYKEGAGEDREGGRRKVQENEEKMQKIQLLGLTRHSECCRPDGGIGAMSSGIGGGKSAIPNLLIMGHMAGVGDFLPKKFPEGVG